ncbi:MAG: hypothetical protein II917_09600 [Synergistaceae bacterium]|nr:hypothetical protein [Synergistaceae bacterium]
MNDKSFDGYDSFEDWLDATRVSLYEEIKDMTPEEHVAYIRAQTEPIMKQYGLEYSTLTPVKPVKRERVAMTV